MQIIALIALLLGGGPTTGAGSGGPSVQPSAKTQPTCGNGPMACDTPLRVNPVNPGSCNPLNRQVVVTVGDSIMAGLNNGGPTLLQTELGQGGYYVQGCAMGGDRVADCIARFNANAHVGANIVAWNCAINNILNGDSAATTWAQAEAALNIIRGQGVKVVVASIGPCGGYSGCDNAANDTYNSLLENWCTAEGSANCYFWNANAYLASAGDPNVMRAECVTDFLHPSAVCEPGYFDGFATGAEALVSQFPPPPNFPTPLAGALYFAPPGGWGMGAQDCTGQPVVDVRQNAVTYGRSAGVSGDGGVAVATCVRTSDGLGVEMTASQPIVETLPGSTTRGALNEGAGTNFLNATWDLAASTWTATATVTRDVWSGPFSHYGAARGFEQLNDTNVGASQSVCQTLSTSTTGSYAFTCWLRAGTLTTARMSITGTGNTAGNRTCSISGLDTALSYDDRKGCVTSAFGGGLTAITACVLPGTNDAATGTIGAVDCQLEKLDHVTSYIPNGWPAGTSTRLVSGLTVPTAPASLTLSNTQGCAAADYYVRQYDTEAWWSFISMNRTARGPYSGTSISMSTFDGTNAPTVAVPLLWNVTASGVARWAPDGGLTIASGASGTTSAYDGTMFGTTIAADSFGIATSPGSQDALVANVRLALSDTACDAGIMANITRVGWLGDSISARVTPDPINPPLGFFQRESVNGTNLAVIGARFSAAASNCVAQWAAGGNGTYDTIVLWCGVNDILVSVLGASLFAEELAWVREWAYRGVKVYWADIAPFAGYDSAPAKLAERNTFNALHAAYCSAPETNITCVPIAVALEEPGNPNYLNPPYSFDGLHLTQAGATQSSITFGAHYP